MSAGLRLGIDASNLRAGGGITHLAEVLRAGDPEAHGFSQVVVWGATATLAHLEDRTWLVRHCPRLLDRGLIFRTFWQRFRLARAATATNCDVLLIPGGSYAGAFRPVVTMCRNMLPFDWRELLRYGFSAATLQFFLLRWIQSRTFRRADGVIFLTRFARDRVLKAVGTLVGAAATIPHGAKPSIVEVPRRQVSIDHYSVARPFRILYVSSIQFYKHQWHVAEAVAHLRAAGLPVVLDLVGLPYAPALRRLRAVMSRIDPEGQFIRYHGGVPHAALSAWYADADVCVFASSCENMPNILLEGMAAGLPIACSDRGPMPEVLGDAGVYFDPEQPATIARALRDLITAPELRQRLSHRAAERAVKYTWQTCADETLSFIKSVTERGTNDG